MSSILIYIDDIQRDVQKDISRDRDIYIYLLLNLDSRRKSAACVALSSGLTGCRSISLVSLKQIFFFSFILYVYACKCLSRLFGRFSCLALTAAKMQIFFSHVIKCASGKQKVFKDFSSKCMYILYAHRAWGRIAETYQGPLIFKKKYFLFLFFYATRSLTTDIRTYK